MNCEQYLVTKVASMEASVCIPATTNNAEIIVHGLLEAMDEISGQ